MRGSVVRFSGYERFEHFAVMSLFTVLSITGFPQKFYDHRWAQVLVGWLGGVDTARWFHRAAGTLFTALVVVHVVRIVMSLVTGRTQLTMVPTRRDFDDAVQTLRYYFGMRDTPARFDHFDYRQKFEYWGLLLGGAVMIGTGFILLLPILMTRFLPGELVPVAKVAHSNEGLMAFLVVITWHIFNAHLAPGIFPYDASIFTGKIPLHRMKHEHPLEYERLVKTEPAPEDPAKTPAPPLGSPSGAVGG